jgi:gluconate 5-dehydrogenase
MEKQGRGVIINNASLWGIVSPDPRTYLDLKNEPPIFLPAAKAGVVQLSKYLAVLYASKGIRVNAISPGFFPQRRGPDRPDYMREITARIPMARIGLPHEIAGIVAFLFSDAASYMTGQNIIVDGGYTLW